MSEQLVDCNYCFSKRPQSDANGPNCEGCFIEQYDFLSKEYKKLIEEYTNMYPEQETYQGEDQGDEYQEVEYQEDEDEDEDQEFEDQEDEEYDLFNTSYQLVDRPLEEGEYIADGVLYASTFPIDLAGSHPESGPKYCGNCAYYGCNEKGAFVGFCLNCFHYNYPDGPCANFNFIH
jgi:hypothetical protein